MLSLGCSNVVLFFFHAVWQEILRGPRPPAARWSRADGNVQRNSSRAGRDSVPVQGPRNPVAGRRGSVHGQDQRRLNPEEVMVNARMRVTKLETALAAVGQENPAHPILFEALQHVRSQAQIRRRVRKVLDEAEAKIHEEEGELEEGERRLAALFQEAEVSPAAQFSQPPPTVPFDCAAELAQLSVCGRVEGGKERSAFSIGQCIFRTRRTLTTEAAKDPRRSIPRSGSAESEWDSVLFFRDVGDHDRQCFMKLSEATDLS